MDANGQPHLVYKRSGELVYIHDDGGWQTEVIAGGISYGPIALDVDFQGNPHVLYKTGSEIWYAYRGATAWEAQLLGYSWEGRDADLAVDSEGFPHVGYAEGHCGGHLCALDLQYVHQDATGWHTETAATVSTGPIHLALDQGDSPHFLLNPYPRYATLPERGSTWLVEVIEGEGTSGALAVEPGGIPHVLYAHPVGLQYAIKSSSGWVITDFDRSAPGRQDLAIDAGGGLHFAYPLPSSDGLHQDLVYRYWNDQGWHFSLVEQSVDAESIALAVDGQELPHLTFLRAGELVYARRQGDWSYTYLPVVFPPAPGACDGAAIVYQWWEPSLHSNSAIHRLDLCRDRVVGLTDEIGDPIRPAWSPDGGRIAFLVRFPGGLYTIRPDGSELTRVTQLFEFPALSGFDWSPDAQQLVVGLNGAITIINADGSGPVDLTGAFGGDQPKWSPAGDWIAFWHDDGAGGVDLYLVSVDGTQLVNLTPDLDERVRAHAWSPDGSWLAFEAGELEETDIYIVDISGGAPLNLTASPGKDEAPDWSPDGTRLAFSSNRAGTWDIFVMNADGSGQTNLTEAPGRQETDPAWSPDGAWIAFVLERPYTAGFGYDLYALPVAGGDLWHLAYSQYSLSHLDWHPGFAGVPGGP